MTIINLLLIEYLLSMKYLAVLFLSSSQTLHGITLTLAKSFNFSVPYFP